MWATSVPQQPPIMLTPSSSTKRSSHCANSAAPSGYCARPATSSGKPALGWTEIRPDQFSPSHLTCSAISRGPVAQLSPMTGTSSASTIVAAAAMSAPTSRLPVVSIVTWTRIGVSLCASSRARLAPLTAALTCSGSWQVSMTMASTAAGDQPGALGGQRVFELLVGDMAERRQAGPRPDRAQHETGAAVMREFGDRFARDLGGKAVERKGTVGETELAQGDRRAAKAVGLDRVAAGGEIAAMDLADQIGAALADDLGAILVAEKIALDVEVARLHLGPHRAVAQHDAIGEIVEEMGHLLPSALTSLLAPQCGGEGGTPAAGG